MTDITDMTNEVVEWIGDIIPDSRRDPFNTAIKMGSEANELLHALHTGGDVEQEAADIMILLLDICYLRRIDLKAAVEAKMQVNRNRTWVETMGSLRHD